MNRLYRHLHMNYSEGKKVAAEGEEQNVMEIGEAMLITDQLLLSWCYHGRRSRGVRGNQSPPPRIWSGGIVPPDFVMFQNFKHQITCITM